MYIENLSLQNFRSYETAEINLSPGINLFKGDNAQGKTNILESIYLCATGRSHRTSHEKEMICWNKDSAHISLTVCKKFMADRIDFNILPKAKKVFINKMPVAKMGELYGAVNVVMFSPEDLQLVKNSPKERRRFVDMELCQIDKVYYYALKQYNKILKQRNLCLKDFYKNPDYAMLDVWDMQLIEYAQVLVDKRREFVDELDRTAAKIHSDLSSKKENLKIIYLPSINSCEIGDKLNKYRERDIINQTTSIGPHRDDLKFEIDGMDVKTYGSQGQQRTVVLSTKLAELEIMTSHIGDTPILLLDDVLSELDDGRQRDLFKYTENLQTLITCTGIEQSVWDLNKIGKIYTVTKGELRETPSIM